MHPKTHIYPHCYTPYEVLINMYPRNTHYVSHQTVFTLNADAETTAVTHQHSPKDGAEEERYKGNLCTKS